jgi:hypothetical protein
MVTVHDIVPEVPALHKDPAFLYFSDHFLRPQPFRPDIVFSIDDVYQKKLDMLDAHVSQFYEWVPWHDDQLDDVPKDPAARKRWLMTRKPSVIKEVAAEWRAGATGKAVLPRGEQNPICRGLRNYGIRASAQRGRDSEALPIFSRNSAAPLSCSSAKLSFPGSMVINGGLEPKRTPLRRRPVRW